MCYLNVETQACPAYGSTFGDICMLLPDEESYKIIILDTDPIFKAIWETGGALF